MSDLDILYIAPHPGRRNGIADYADVFQAALTNHVPNLTMHRERLLAGETTALPNFNRVQEIRRQVKSWVKNSFPYHLIHIELGCFNHHEFYYAHFIRKFARGVPMITTLHDAPLMVNGVFKFLEGSSRSIFGRGSSKIMEVMLGRRLENQMITHFQRIFVFTTIARKALTRKWAKLPVHHVVTIPQMAYQPQADIGHYQHDYDQSPAVILFLGMIGESKGIQTLLQAYKILKQTEPKRFDGSELWIAGAGVEQNMIKQLGTQTAALGIADNVRMLGYIPEPGLYETLKRATMLVLPHLPHKAMSISGVLIRGMELGLPVIASNVRGFPEEIKDGQTGLLFQPNDAPDLAHQIRRLLMSPEQREHLGQAAKRHILTEHSQAVVAQKVFLCYKEILDENRRFS